MSVLFLSLPSAFLPDEDQGYLFVQVQAPPGATSGRTEAVLDTVRRYFLEDEKDAVDAVFTVSGFSFAGRGQNGGIAFIKLKDWRERSAPERKVKAISARARARFAGVKDALGVALPPPPGQELGNTTSVAFSL